jgi:hypothetical protein
MVGVAGLDGLESRRLDDVDRMHVLKWLVLHDEHDDFGEVRQYRSRFARSMRACGKRNTRQRVDACEFSEEASSPTAIRGSSQKY